MRPETEAFLALVRHSGEPSRADEERVLLALQTSVAAGFSANEVVKPASESTSWSTAGAKLGAWGSKLSLIAACAAATFTPADTPPPPLARSSMAASAAAALPISDAPGVTVLELVQPEPRPTESIPSAKRVAPRARAEMRPPVPLASLREELSVLREVQAALKRGEGEAALSKLDSHKTADRRLLAEREAARILALCTLGRVGDARRAAERFAEAHPESLQRPVIARSCANSQRMSQP